jgi:outer membrane protein assembly factor BamB
VAELATVRQVVAVCYRSIIGVALDTGRVLWEEPYESLKYPHSLTPLIYGDTIVMSGSGKGLSSFRVIRDAASWWVKRAWHNESVSMTLSSPLLHGDFLFGLGDRNRGQFVCVDARSGALIWASEGREGETAAVLGAGDQILFVKDQGELVVVDADPHRLNIIAKYTIADAPIWTIPAVVAGQLLVRHGDALTRWDVPSP